MAIILEGSGKQYDEIRSKLDALDIGPAYKRVIGYLFYELAGLKTLEDIRKRLESIDAKRNSVLSAPGMDEKTTCVNVAHIGDVLSNIQELIKTHYNDITELQQNTLKVFDWSDDSEDAASAYFRYILRRHAERLVTEAGAER